MPLRCPTGLRYLLPTTRVLGQPSTHHTARRLSAGTTRFTSIRVARLASWYPPFSQQVRQGQWDVKWLEVQCSCHTSWFVLCQLHKHLRCPVRNSHSVYRDILIYFLYIEKYTFMFIYIYIYMYMCIYIYTYIYVNMFVCMYIQTYVDAYIHRYIYVWMATDLATTHHFPIYICVCVCIHLMYIYI